VSVYKVYPVTKCTGSVFG